MSISFSEKRRSKRKPVSLNTRLTSDGINYSGIIENICEHGLHLITAPKKNKASFVPEKILELKVNNPWGSKASLHCEVRWVHINKTPIHGLMYRMGMEIIETPQ